MNALTFLSVLAAMSGAISAWFLARGVTALTAKDIHALSGTYWDFNKALRDNLVDQRADYLVGVIAFGVAFALQLAALIVEGERIFESGRTGWLVALAGSTVWLCFLMYVRRQIYRRDMAAVVKLREEELAAEAATTRK